MLQVLAEIEAGDLEMYAQHVLEAFLGVGHFAQISVGAILLEAFSDILPGHVVADARAPHHCTVFLLAHLFVH